MFTLWVYEGQTAIVVGAFPTAHAAESYATLEFCGRRVTIVNERTHSRATFIT